MQEKKEIGGLTDDSLLQPGDGTELNSNNIIDTTKDEKEPESVLGQNFFGPGAGEISRGIANPFTGGTQVSSVDYDEYDKYIDRPFSINESDIDDTRAEGQSFGEKFTRSYGAQLPVGIFTNVLGNTVGLGVGLAEVIDSGFRDGFGKSSTWGKFFNNDFQRSLDDINESVRESLPNYYTSKEAEYGAFKAAFGPGAANFWTDGMANGLSFVAGAVISEFATAGLASALIPAKAANHMKRIAALRNTSYGQKAIQGNANLQRINRNEKIYQGLVAARRFATGAMYESGVEARHNFDSTVSNLVDLHTERTGEAPTEQDMLNINQIAYSTANGVFAANAALVGYSNMLMFPKIFGKGAAGMKKNLSGKFKKVKKDGVTSLLPKYKDYNTFRKISGGLYTVLKRPLYEGFVEEGGQKLADIAGQKAAEQYYIDGKNPTSLEALGGLLSNTYDSFGEAYGSPEGQKEIFMGFILGGLGLPTFVKTNPDTGQREFGLGWQGGIKESIQERIRERKDLSDLADYMNKNPDALQAIKTNFEMASDMTSADKSREYALLTDNNFAYKNADHDAFFSYVYHRMKAGYFGDVIESLEDIRSMENDAFEEMFDYGDMTSNMSTKERAEFLEDRKNKVIEQHKERAHAIKELMSSTDGINVNDNYRKALVHAYSSAKDLDAREELLIEELTNEGLDLSAEQIEDIPANDKAENESFLQRVKNFTMDKLGQKAVDVMENSKVGKEIKKQLGIKQFTEPAHPQLVLQGLSEKASKLEKKAEALENSGKDIEALEVLYELDEVREQMVDLAIAMKQGVAPNLSSEEQQVLDKFEKENPAQYLKKKDEYIQKLQDLRNIRAQRHRMLNLVQQLIDPDAREDKIQQVEQYIEDVTQSEEFKGLSDYEKNLARKYRGKIVEFDYTNKNGEKKTYRAYYKEQGDKGLVVIPDSETFKMLKRLEQLSGKVNKTPRDQEEIDKLTEALETKQTKFQTFDPSNKSLENWKIVDRASMQLEGLQASIDVLERDLVANLEAVNEEVYETQFQLLEIAENAQEVLSAIQNAKRDKNNQLYVNLNAIGKKGKFGIEGAQKALAEILAKENELKGKESQLVDAIATLEEHSLKIQVIHNLLTNPESVSDILERPATQEDAFELINEFLGLISEEDFYKGLVDQGYFDKNTLTDLALTSKEEGKEVDKQVLKELLNMFASDNVPNEFLELINEDLAKFQKELTKLSEHRKDVENVLNKFTDESGNVKMFPPEGLTMEDQAWLSNELVSIDRDIATLQNQIKEMQASTKESLTEDLGRVKTQLDNQGKAQVLQQAITNTLSEFIRWQEGVMTPAEKEVRDDKGKNTNINVEYTDDQLWSDNGVTDNNRPSILDIPFTKTAGNHKAALTAFADYQEILAERDLTESEKMHYEHVMSQMRFFRATENVTDWSKKSGNRLMVIHRNNIPAELQDQIIFFDSNTGDIDYTKKFVYLKDLKDATTEENENIKLVLVDKDLNPVLIDGKLAYTDMPTAKLTGPEGEYRYNVDRDLNEDGSIKAAVKEVSDRHSEDRQKLLTAQVPLYYRISGKSKSMTIWENGNPQSRGSVLGRLVQDEKHVQDIQLKAALGTKGESRANINIGGNSWNVPNGFLYLSKPGMSGIKGNLVRGWPQNLGENAQNNVYNLLRLFATRQKLVAQDQMSGEEAALIGGKGLTTILSEMIFFGKQAKDRKLKEYSIWLETDAIHYGNKGQKITLEQLSDPKQYAAEHTELLEFLPLLIHNANSTRLGRDEKARTSATAAKSKAIKAAKGKAKLYAKKKNFPPEYEAHVEVIVNNDLEVETIEWANYTEYLLSTKGRDITDIPVTVNMNLDSSQSKDVEQSTVPQFMNMYLKHNGNPETKDEILNGIENQENAEENSPTVVEATVTDTGEVVVTTTEKSLMTEEEASKIVEEQLKPTPVQVLDNEGNVIFEGIINVAKGKDLPAGIAEALRGALVPTQESKVIQKVNMDQGKQNMENSPFTNYDPNKDEDAEDDSPFLLKSSVEFENEQLVDLDGQLKWFNANMPKDKNGNPLIGINLVKGLIDGKGYGKFTKDGNILLSSEMDVDGVVYHETWHGVTRRLISKEDRFKMYDEARKLRGTARTFKGDVKKLSEFTDREIDEWLAEEFRAYVLADGDYRVGQNVKKSWLDRLFDKIFAALNFFTDSTSGVENLMSKIHGGYFANPTTEITLYDSNEEAYMEGAAISPTLINNTVEGMTVQLFHLAAEKGLFEIEDIFDTSKQDKVSSAINSLYGGPGQSNTVYNKMLGSLQNRETALQQQLAVAKSKTQKEFVQDQINKVQNTRGLIKSNWEFFQDQHKAYLQRFKMEILDDLEISEDERTGVGFDTAQSEIDPNLTLPHPVRLLISTLPATQEINGKRQLVYNNSGFPKLVDFGSTMAFLYKELANTDPEFIVEELLELTQTRPELKMLVKRLGLSTNDWSDKTGPQVRMITRVVQQFNQANRTFHMQSIDRQGGRFLLDNNSSRIDDLVRNTWKLNFRKSIIDGVGVLKDGKMVVDKNAKVTINKVTKSLEEWSKVPKDSLQAAALLSAIGIKFSDTPAFMEKYEDSNEIKDAVTWTLNEVLSNPISDLYEGDIQGRLKVLMNVEIEKTNYAVDLIHINAAGKKVYGISLKNHLDVTASELNNNPERVVELLGHANLANSVYLQGMAQQGRKLEISVLEDIKQEFGRSKGLSKSTPSDIAGMQVNAILGNGIMPFIRTADKKTEYGIGFGVPASLTLSKQDMVKRLQGYLFDEIKTATIFNSNKTSKLRRIENYADQGGELRFFKGIIDISRKDLSKKLSDEKIAQIVSSPEVESKLNEFLEVRVQEVTNSLLDFNIIRPGKQGSSYNVGINSQLVSKLKMVSQDNTTDTSTLMPSTVRVLSEQLTYEHMTGVIEQSKLFLGDLALYKDLFKRTSGVSGTKIYPSSDPHLLEWMNNNMENLGMNKEHSSKIKTVVRGDVKVDSPYLQDYIDVVRVLNPSMLDNLNEKGENILEQTYNNMDEFDGGGFMHLDAYRSLLWRAGKWTDAQENLYQKIMNGDTIANEDLAYFPALKPQVFAPFIEDNVRLMTFHKFALFPLIPQLMPGRTYDDINQDMVDNDIDYMVFNSVVKVGAPTIDGQNFDSFYQEDGNYSSYKPMELSEEDGEPLGLLEFDFSQVGIQVEIAPKIKNKVSAGTQLTSLLPINIYENGQVSEVYKEAGLESVIDEYHEVSYQLIKRDIEKLTKRLNLEMQDDGRYLAKDMKVLSDAIISELDKRDMPMHTKNGILALLKSDNPFINQLFERDKIESILYAIVTNSVIKRKMPGDMMVLQAATGLEIQARAIKQKDYEQANKDNIDIAMLKPLKFYRPGKDKTLAMQVMLPHRFKELGLGNLIDANNIDEGLKQLIGFRIPTEGLNSIDFIEVVGYLPPSAGSTIIVPSEIVGKSGSDYDIDKLTLYFPNYTYNEESNTVSRIPYLTDENSTVEERYEVMKQEEPRDLTLSQFSKLPISDQNIQVALQNRVQEIIKTVLENPQSFDQLITPVGAFEVKNVAREIAALRDKRGKGKGQSTMFNKKLSFGNLVNTSYRMWSGLGGVGIVAVTATQHAKAQRAGLDWSPEIDLQLNFAGTGYSLSRVSDVNGGMKISSVLAQYVTGYVDVTKEDFVFDINAGVEYAPIHMMLVRSGVPLDQVAYFMSQPIIDDYVNLNETQRSLAAQYSGGKSYMGKEDMYSTLKTKYGARPESEPVKFNADVLKDMVGKDISELSRVEKQMQSQILDDFIRYQEYADFLFLLTTATKFDTSKLSGPTAIKYMKAALARVEDTQAFVNVDNLIYNQNGKYSLMSAFREGFDAGSKMFSSLDMKEYHPYISKWTYDKIYELTNPTLRRSADEIGYVMKRFDSHLSSYIVQNTPLQRSYLKNKISSLFRGDNSLPRRILAAKGSPRLKDNLLIQELYPLLQTFQDPKHPEYSIDNMKLFSKKLQTFDIDLLSDSYLELQEIAPQLAKDLVEFSVLQSGFHFSPNAFFQVLPSTEVLNIISPYFNRYSEEFNLNLDNVWEDFIQNSSSDGKIVPRLPYRINEKRKQSFKDGTIIHNSQHEYVSISAPTGAVKTVGSITKPVYETKLFINTGPSKKTPSMNVFTAIPKRGMGMNLIESNTDSLLKSNVSKFGLDTLDISKGTEQVLDKVGSAVIIAKTLMPSGMYLTNGDARVHLDIIGTLSINDIYKGSKKAIAAGLTLKGREGLEELAVAMGYRNWEAAKKAKANKQLVDRKSVVLYRATTLDSSNYTTKDSYDDFGYDPTRQQGTEQLFKSKDAISNEVNQVLKEKDNCKKSK